MPVWPAEPDSPQTLHSSEGELVSLRIAVEPRFLEALLEALAALDFPVNPQLYHRPAQVLVEFPAYWERISQVRTGLSNHGFDPNALEVSKALAAGYSG